MTEKVRVMVVDDTITYRKILSNVIESFDDAELVGTAGNGMIAIEKMKTCRPDLVCLDIVMPQLNGIETLKILRRDYPDVGVVMVSSYDREDADITVKALRLGAIDFVAKPVGGTTEDNFRELRSKLKPLISLFLTRKYTSQAKNFVHSEDIPARPASEARRETPPVPRRTARNAPGRIDLVVIGVSTGGPKALAEVLAAVKLNAKVPILIVQHMPPVFTASLAEHLSRGSAYPVAEGQPCQPVTGGAAFLAPGGKHMELRRTAVDDEYLVEINSHEPVNSCRPSADVLFGSVARNFDGNCLAIVLTGMGADGRDGVRLLKDNLNTYCICQDESSCVVYGMPKAVVDAGLADEVLSCEAIGQRINELLGTV